MVKGLIFLCLIVIWQGVFAYYDGFLTQTQITAQGYSRGLSFYGHGQMWTDFFLISPVVAYLVDRYSDQWSTAAVIICGIVASVMTGVLHNMYIQSPVPGCHAHDGYLTWAGWIHIFFMCFAFTVLLLFFFKTVASHSVIVITAVIVFVHLAVGAIQIPYYLGEKGVSTINLVQIVVGLLMLAASSAYAWRNSPKLF